MPNYSKKVVYLTNEQYQTLATNGTITVNGTTVTYNENDLYVTPQVYPVSDVQVNGTSVLSNGVANVPVASSSTFGVVKTNVQKGTSLDDNGVLQLHVCNISDCKNANNSSIRNPVCPPVQHASAFYGLAKASGDTTQAQSNNSVGTYTDSAKQAIQTMLGTNSMLAPIEADYVADRTYAIGDLFCMDGKLYKVTAAINQNGTITPGTNCSETSVSGTYAAKTDTVLNTTLSRGRKANTTVGTASFAFGYNAEASGQYSYAEGINTSATAKAAHSEGAVTTASANYSHAEGTYTTANGVASHSEGWFTTANGAASHVEGLQTIANGYYSHVFGEYNVPDDYTNWPEWVANTEYSVGDKIKVTVTNGNDTTVTGYICKTANSDSEFTVANWDIDTYINYVEIVGNGNSTTRSNAYALDWDGNGHFAGNVYVGANADSSGGTMLPTDVQVNGTSVVSNGVANVPMAATDVYGVIKNNSIRGVGITNNGELYTVTAGNSEVKRGVHTYNSIVPSNQHTAAFYGLAKAAGDTTQSDSSNAVGTYTPEAKAAIQSMLGVETGVVFVESVSGTTPTITGVANTRYVCGEVSTIDITPPVSGTIDVTFTSGSTPALLTLPNTVKFPAWVDLTTLDADTTYEIMITDGVYGGVMTWPV